MMEPIIAVYSEDGNHTYVEVKGASATMIRSVAAHLIMADIDAQHESEIGKVTRLGAFFFNCNDNDEI